MYDVLKGIRVIEVAQYAFVPSAGVILADWGADVVKVVHPEVGDPLVGTAIGGIGKLPSGTSYLWEMLNRGKRCVGIDLAAEEGRALLHELVRGADVFLTSFLPQARQKLGIDNQTICEANPSIVYAKGSAFGPRGPEQAEGGYDLNAFWARSGIGHAVSSALHSQPEMPAPAMGDVPSGFALASGVVGALLKRERSGRAPSVDVSLLGWGVWINGPLIIANHDAEIEIAGPPFANSLARAYRTKDGRYLYFAGLRLDLYWDEFCERIHRPDLATDERFKGAGRVDNNAILGPILASVFEEKTLAHWREVLKDMKLPWTMVQTPHEVHSDPQVVTNGYIVPEITGSGGDPVHLPASPVQFDGHPLVVTSAPVTGQHTEEILLELGVEWEEIARLKDRNVIS